MKDKPKVKQRRISSRYQVALTYDVHPHLPYKLAPNPEVFTSHVLVDTKKKAEWVAAVLYEYQLVQDYLAENAIEVD